MKYQLDMFFKVIDEVVEGLGPSFPAFFEDRGKSGEKAGKLISLAAPCITEGPGEGPRSPSLAGGVPPSVIQGDGRAKEPLSPQDELKKIKEAIAELSSEQREIEDVLIEPNGQRHSAEAVILRTHGDGRAYDFSLETKVRRIEEYNLLLSLAIQYGPLRNRRRDLMAMIKRYGREADKLEKLVQQQKRKEKPRG